MAVDETLAALIRADLAGRDGVAEKRMFGGLCFLLNGNMLCAVHGADSMIRGGMFRVGKAAEARALALDGVAPMEMRGRRMGGFVDARAAAIEDGARRSALLGMALAFTGGLPPK